jgi:hypothetical protein
MSELTFSEPSIPTVLSVRVSGAVKASDGVIG